MLKGFLDEEMVLQIDAETSLEGYMGLWTKADSKVYFDDMTIQEGNTERVVIF